MMIKNKAKEIISIVLDYLMDHNYPILAIVLITKIE